MRDIDIQAEGIKKFREEEEKINFAPEIKKLHLKSRVLNDIEIEYNKYYHG